MLFCVGAVAPTWAQSKLDTQVSDFIAAGDNIQDVMAILGQDLNLRIVVSPNVKGAVNASLQNVTLRQILDTILPPLQARYMEKDSIIQIMTEAEWLLQNPPELVTETRTWRLQNRRVEDVKAVVESLKTKEGTVTLDVEANSITVRDTPSTLAGIDEAILRITSEEIVSRTFEIENADIKEVVDQLKEVLSGEPEIIVDERLRLITIRSTLDNVNRAEDLINLLTRPNPLVFIPINFLKRDQIEDVLDVVTEMVGEDVKKLRFHEPSRKLIVEAPPFVIRKIRQIIDEFDIRTRQVMIDCEIVQVGDVDNFSLGVDWAIGNDVGKAGLTGTATDAAPLTNVYGGVDDLFRLGSTGLDAFFLRPEDYLLTINALKQRTDTTTLASPRLFVKDDGYAKFHDGSSEPVATVNYGYGGYGGTNNNNDPYGGGSYANQRNVEVGIKLELDEVHIAENGYVELTVVLEDSAADPNRVDLGPNLTGLRTTKTEIDTEVVLKDHHTAVMGGVIRRRKSLDRTGVPILSEIPLLGMIFRNTSHADERRRLLLFITPHIVDVERPFDMNYTSEESVYDFYQQQGIVDWRDEEQKKAEAEHDAALRERGITPESHTPPPGEPLEAGGRVAIPMTPPAEPAVEVEESEKMAPSAAKEAKESPRERRRTSAGNRTQSRPGQVKRFERRTADSPMVWDPGLRLLSVESGKSVVFQAADGRQVTAKIGDVIGNSARLVSVHHTEHTVQLMNTEPPNQMVRLQATAQ